MPCNIWRQKTLLLWLSGWSTYNKIEIISENLKDWHQREYSQVKTLHEKNTTKQKLCSSWGWQSNQKKKQIWQSFQILMKNSEFYISSICEIVTYFRKFDKSFFFSNKLILLVKIVENRRFCKFSIRLYNSNNLKNSYNVYDLSQLLLLVFREY